MDLPGAPRPITIQGQPDGQQQRGDFPRPLWVCTWGVRSRRLWRIGDTAVARVSTTNSPALSCARRDAILRPVPFSLSIGPRLEYSETAKLRTAVMPLRDDLHRRRDTILAIAARHGVS